MASFIFDQKNDNKELLTLLSNFFRRNYGRKLKIQLTDSSRKDFVAFPCRRMLHADDFCLIAAKVIDPDLKTLQDVIQISIHGDYNLGDSDSIFFGTGAEINFFHGGMFTIKSKGIDGEEVTKIVECK